MLNLVGEVPKKINELNKKEIIEYFAFTFQESFNDLNLKRFRNIEAYLTNISNNIEKVKKDKFWCLIILYVLKDFCILDKLSTIEDIIDKLISNINYIDSKYMMSYINEINLLLFTLNKNVLISLPSKNNSDKAILKNTWLEIYKILNSTLEENDINDEFLIMFFNKLKNKNFNYSTKKEFLADIIIFECFIKFDKKDKHVFPIILNNICLPIINKNEKAELIAQKINEIY